MNVSGFGEFGLIDRIADLFEGLIPSGVTGIGDDCAVIPMGGDESLLVTTDMLVENIHFLRNSISPFHLGRKSLTVNLSDISAMGGSPFAFFLSLGIPQDISGEWINSFMDGLRSHGIPLLGGDTSKTSGEIVINITMIGLASPDHIKYRHDARPDDVIFVTGNLGDSAAGLKAIQQDIESCSEVEELIGIHNDPAVNSAMGKWLGKQKEVHAMIDISDGLSSDLGHILTASNVGAKIETADLPISKSLRNIAHDNAWDIVSLAIEGGEDYQLLFTVESGKEEALKQRFFEEFGAVITEIGTITDSGRLEWVVNATPIDATFKGFRHF